MKISSNSTPTMRPRPFVRHNSVAKRGFTLIELMVVLAIMAVVSAITLGAFNSLSDTNQRTGCQANMAQVYQGLRQYMSDNDGQPPYYDPTRPAYSATVANSGRGIGLWALWTFPDSTNPDKVAKIGEKPYATYLRNSKVLHCPSDSEAVNWEPITAAESVMPQGKLHSELYANDDKTEYNMGYLSYQGYDVLEPPAYVYPAKEPTLSDPEKIEKSLYLPLRTTTNGTPEEKQLFKRQLLQKTVRDPLTAAIARPPQENAVVMWCQYHRLTRDYDNVLFFDGSVQLLPRVQDNLDATCNPKTAPDDTLEHWQRLPRRSDCDQ